MSKVFYPGLTLNPRSYPHGETAPRHLHSWRRRGSAARQSRHDSDMASGTESGQHWLDGGARTGLQPGATRRASDRALHADAKATVAPVLLRAEYARLDAVGRAAVSAPGAGAAEPLVYVEAELIRRGGLPPRDATVLTALADARTAMITAGEAASPPDRMKRNETAEGSQGPARTLVGATGVS
jgi:hypothetical protein